MSFTVRTEILRMPAKQMAITMFYLYGTVPLAVVALSAIPALALGIFMDIRWLMVFLMIVFLLVPMFLSFLYFYHGLRPSTASNTANHRVEFVDEGMMVTIIDLKPSAGDEQSLGEPLHQSGEKTLRECIEKTLTTRFYPYSSVKSTMTSRDGVILLLDSPHKGFLWLPYRAFPDTGDFTVAISAVHACNEAASHDSQTQRVQTEPK